MALQICHESREEALRCYILSFGTTTYPATVYFNYHIDTLLFGDEVDKFGLLNPRARAREDIGASDYLLNLWHGRTLNPRNPKAIQAKNVRYVTLDADENIYSVVSFCWEEIRCFKGLEELILVTWDPENRADELMAYFRTTLNTVAKANPEWCFQRLKLSLLRVGNGVVLRSIKVCLGFDMQLRYSNDP